MDQLMRRSTKLIQQSISLTKLNIFSTKHSLHSKPYESSEEKGACIVRYRYSFHSHDREETKKTWFLLLLMSSCIG